MPPFDLVISYNSIGSYYQVTVCAAKKEFDSGVGCMQFFFLQVKARILFFSDLLPAVDEFVKEQTIKYYDDVSAELIHKTRNGDIDVEEVIRAWEKAFREVLCTAFNTVHRV